MNYIRLKEIYDALPYMTDEERDIVANSLSTRELGQIEEYGKREESAKRLKKLLFEKK